MTKVIAIVDDEAEMEFIYSMIFEDAINAGLIKFKFFVDAYGFFNWFETEKPDLILCDINMPVYNGIDLVQKLNATGHNILTYFISGHEEKDYSESMKKLGIRRYLSKPMDFDKFLSFVTTDLQLSPSAP